MKDHRDNPVRVRIAVSSWILPRWTMMRGLRHEQIRRLWEADRQRLPSARGGPAQFAIFALLLIISLGCLLVSLILKIRSGAPISGPEIVTWTAMVLIQAMSVHSLRLHARALREDPMGMDTYLTRALCPACTYPIAAIPAESDGCRICPECGAAWRLAEPPAAS